MKQYVVTGMTCAACSSRVEKAVSKVSGVKFCSVSLLTNSMGVEGTASDTAIIAAVKKAPENVEGVSHALVSHESKTAVVTLTKAVPDTALKQVVEDEDYRVMGIV